MTKKEIGAVIRQYRQKAGLTQAFVAEQLNRPQQTIANWEIGRSQPDANTLFVLFRILGANLDEAFGFSNGSEPAKLSVGEQGLVEKYRALDEHGKRMVDFVTDEEIARIQRARQEQLAPRQVALTTYINCYDLAVSAGPGEPWGEDYGYKTRVEIPTERVPHNAHYCARVTGNSMEPLYKDGDIVFVQRMEEFVNVGEIGIFYFNGDGFIKKLGNRQLISLNPEYDPIEIHEYDDIRCQGRVLGKADIR